MEDASQPATRQDLEQVADQLRSEMTQMRSEMTAMEDRLIEAFRDGQTELLKAFYNYAQSTDLKLKDAEVSDISLRQRLSVIESRVTEIEKRLNFPPAA